MTPRTITVPLALLFTLAGCDTDTDTSDDTLRSHGHHGHGKGHHGHGTGKGKGKCHEHCDEKLDISDLLVDYDEATNPYSDPALWLSGPDAVDDFVLSVNLDTTIVYPDLSTQVIHPVRKQAPDVDIFFIHPTVNLSPEPGNDDLSDLTNHKTFTLESAARFSTIGRVIAPLYHSSTAGCFMAGDEMLAECLEVAYQDVESSFEYYLATHWEGQKLVIMGWSQGAVMTRMLMQRFVDGHPDLMRRVALVMPMSGDLEVDALDSIPACENKYQTRCYITYHSYLDGLEPQTDTLIGSWADSNAACTDVVGAADEPGVFTMSYFSVPTAPGMLPSEALAAIPLEITTPYIAFPKFYAGSCVDNDQGYLEVVPADPNDERWTPINYSHFLVVPDPPFGLGLHMFDFSLGMSDLLYLVDKKSKKLEDNDEFCVEK